MKEIRYDQVRRYDADEPFWTSNGTVTRADGDGIGDNGTHYTHGYSGYDGTSSISAEYTGVISNYTLRLNKSSYTIWTAHRPENDTETWRWTTDNAFKLEQAGAIAVLSDDLAQLWGLDRNSGHTTYVNSVYPVPVAPERYSYLLGRRITNHDWSYNLLFTDGSVQTFTDGSRSAWRTWCDEYVRNGSYPDTDDETLMSRMIAANTEYAIEYFVWKPYLDGAYQAD